MKRRIQGLHDADPSRAGEIPDSLYLARVDRAQYRWQAQKPHYVLRLLVLEPKHFAGRCITGRLYCTPKATNIAKQRTEFGLLVTDTIARIEAAEFLPHSGIRFPQNPCSSCPYVGLCLGKQELVETDLVRRPGAENLGWLDEFAY